MKISGSGRWFVWAAAMTVVCGAASAWAIEPQRSWYELPSSNGYTGVVVDLEAREVHHFREHVFATEEPRWNATGGDTWLPTVPGGDCFKPQVIDSRDLLADAYFGYRLGSTSTWLTAVPVDLDASGYDAPAGVEGDGGTGIVRMVQPVPAQSLEFTTRVFAPWSYESAGWVMALEVRNTGTEPTLPMQVYSLIHPNLGFGRPGARREIGSEFETMTIRPDGVLVEQGFAGLVAMHPVPLPMVTTHTPADFFVHVRDGVAGDLPAPAATGIAGNGLAGGFEWAIDPIAPGESAWVSVVIAHDPNPDFVEGRVGAVRCGTGWLVVRRRR